MCTEPTEDGTVPSVHIYLRPWTYLGPSHPFIQTIPDLSHQWSFAPSSPAWKLEQLPFFKSMYLAARLLVTEIYCLSWWGDGADIWKDARTLKQGMKACKPPCMFWKLSPSYSFKLQHTSEQCLYNNFLHLLPDEDNLTLCSHQTIKHLSFYHSLVYHHPLNSCVSCVVDWWRRQLSVQCHFWSAVWHPRWESMHKKPCIHHTLCSTLACAYLYRNIL